MSFEGIIIVMLFCSPLILGSMWQCRQGARLGIGSLKGIATLQLAACGFLVATIAYAEYAIISCYHFHWYAKAAGALLTTLLLLWIPALNALLHRRRAGHSDRIASHAIPGLFFAVMTAVLYCLMAMAIGMACM